MRFYEMPANKSWSDMPDVLRSSSSNDLPQFIREVGDRLGHNYQEGNVGVGYPGMKSAFESYGYSAILSDHSYTDAKNWLFREQEPFLMAGYVNPPIGGIPTGAGHAWVCHGVKEYEERTSIIVEFINPYDYTYYSAPYYNPSNPYVTALILPASLYMNWGHDDYDGWFYHYDDANMYPGVKNYKYNRKNIYAKP
jgi:hypothetical protein